jgi:hypothetical protein
MAQVMPAGEAAWAIYFDFEASGGSGMMASPAVLGCYWDADPNDDEAPMLGRILVVEPKLWSVTGNTAVSNTGGAVEPECLDLDSALTEILTLAEGEGRLLASWSAFDFRAVTTFADPSLAERVDVRWVDAKGTAKRWRSELCPEMKLSSKGPRHTLTAYLKHFGWSHPKKFGDGVAAHGITEARKAARADKSWATMSAKQKEAWGATLAHNYLDCRGAFLVANRCARELEGVG